MNLKQHPLSALFPSMPDEEIQALADDIKAHGQYDAIVLYEGQVLDGWHRYLACKLAGVNPRTIIFKGKDPRTYVRSHNSRRRHMTASQRAFTEVRLVDWAPEGKPVTSENKLVTTEAKMAEEAQVSISTIAQAKKVEADGAEFLKEAVKEGEISVSQAAAIADKPKREQAKAVREAKEPKPKKEKPVEEEDDESMSAASMGRALAECEAERVALQAIVESLQADDLSKELVKWQQKYAKLEGRLALAIKQKEEADKQARYSSGMLAKIRAALKVQTNGEILQAIRNG